MVRPMEPITVPHVPWSTFLRAFINEWEQGEHVAVLGPTGQGKSVLLMELAKARASMRSAQVVIFGTKPKDKTLTAVGWPILKSWEDREFGQDQVILWPDYGDPETAAEKQKEVFRPVLRKLFIEGGRTLLVDEIRDFETRMGLTDLMEEFWWMARSNGISFMAGTQRPRWVSRSMFSEPSWLFLFPFYDIDDLRRISEIGGDTDSIRAVVSELPEHHFLCIRRRTRELVISKVDMS